MSLAVLCTLLLKDLRGQRYPRLRWQGRAQREEIAPSASHATSRNHLLDQISRRRNQERHRPPSIRHLERLPLLYLTQPGAGVLAELADADFFHVLHSSTLATGARRSGRP